MKQITVYKETNEDWHPSYILGKKKYVRVKYCGKLYNINPELKINTYRTCVWGADDFGMEYDTFYEEKAILAFQKIVMSSEPITKEFLRSLGFTTA